MPKKIILALFLSVAFIASSFAEEPVKKVILENGMTVILKRMPSQPVVSLRALIKNGSSTEGKYLGMGLSHFVEHMLFKGTEERPVGQIAKEVQALGGYINASTSLDYTLCKVDLPSEVALNGLDILADMLQHSVFDPREVENEREVVVGEMRLYKDQPARKLSELVFQNVYLRHPYRHPIIGYEPIFRRVSRDELFQYYKDTE